MLLVNLKNPVRFAHMKQKMSYTWWWRSLSVHAVKTVAV
jgi:hypothetical protein